MIENGYKSNECDKYIYYKSLENSQVMITFYVDDLLIFDSNLNVINKRLKCVPYPCGIRILQIYSSGKES